MRKARRTTSRRRLLGFLALLAVAGLAMVWRSTTPPAVSPGGGVDQVDAVVARVVDGDTVRVLVDGDEVVVRVLGIDTPEMPDGCGAQAATDELARLLPAGAPVVLVMDGSADTVDRYGRWLRRIEAGGLDVGEGLIAAGLAA
jgi:micrococcal nuclease